MLPRESMPNLIPRIASVHTNPGSSLPRSSTRASTLINPELLNISNSLMSNNSLLSNMHREKARPLLDLISSPKKMDMPKWFLKSHQMFLELTRQLSISLPALATGLPLPSTTSQMCSIAITWVPCWSKHKLRPIRYKRWIASRWRHVIHNYLMRGLTKIKETARYPQGLRLAIFVSISHSKLNRRPSKESQWRGRRPEPVWHLAIILTAVATAAISEHSELSTPLVEPYYDGWG